MIAHRNLVKDLGRLFFWYPVRWLVLALPFPAVYALGRGLGRLNVALSGRRRTAQIARHIDAALACGPAAARRLAAAHLQHHICNVLEFIKYPQLRPDTLDRLVRLEGREHLDRALQAGRGVVLCTAHFGAKQLLQAALGHSGYRLNQINYYRPDGELTLIQRAVAQRLRQRIESRLPTTFISAVGPLRPVYRCLQRNEVVIVTGDGSGVREHLDGAYLVGELLGRPMYLPTGPVSLAQRTGAALVPVFVVREGPRHRIVIEPALDLPADAPPRAGVDQLARRIEARIRRDPALWEFWEEFTEGHLIPAPADHVQDRQ